jgi:chromosome segregation protein
MGSGVWELPPSFEIERLKAEIERLKAETERLKAETDELRGRHDREVASARKAARQADDRWSTAEGKLVEAMLELGEAEQRTARLLSERDEALKEAGQEHSALLSRVDRLNAAAASAMVGTAEAERLAEEALRRFDAATDDLRSERRRRLELTHVVDELAESKREAQEAVSSHLGDIRRLAIELGEARAEGERLRKENEKLAEFVERLLGENQSNGEEAELLRAENRRISEEVQQVRRSLQELEREGMADVDAERPRERRASGSSRPTPGESDAADEVPPAMSGVGRESARESVVAGNSQADRPHHL